jgi:hypothetical protein
MGVSIPGGLILIFISLSVFWYYNQKAKIRKEERRERLHESRQKLMDSILENSDNK